MLASKLSTQKMIDAGKHHALVYASLAILIVTMASYLFLTTGIHLLVAGFFFGLGYGILQPLFQSFVTGTTPAPKRGVANATYMLSYDIGIGIGSLLMGCLQETIGLPAGFALTAIAYVVGGIIYVTYVNPYYCKLKKENNDSDQQPDVLSQYMEREVYTLQEDATVRDAIAYFSDKHISSAPIVSKDGTMVGFLSDGDIMRYLRTDDHQLTAVDSSELFLDYFWNPDAEFKQKLNGILDLNILEIGTKTPITISVSASLEDVCKLLSEKGIKKVPVVDQNHIVGIISRSAITHYLMKRYLTHEKTQVSV